MYFSHRSARSRGLQAKGERELVPGLGRVSWGRLRRCSQVARGCGVCVCYPGRLSPPSKWPKSSPFIVEGGTRAVHVLLCGVVPTGTACPSPMAYSCSGVVFGVAHPWSTGAAWSSHQILCVVGAPGMPRSGRGDERKPLWMDYARGRNLVGAEAGTAVGGSRQARTPISPRPWCTVPRPWCTVPRP